MLESIKKLREKLRRDKDPLDMRTSFPTTHGFLSDVAVEGYEAALDEIEQEVSERYVELPLDADGVPIRVGDKMETESNCIRVVDVVQVSSRKWSIGLVVNTLDNAFSWHDADRLRHYHKPTVEDVLRDMLDAWDKLPSSVKNEAILTKYAAKLRLAGDGDES